MSTAYVAHGEPATAAHGSNPYVGHLM